MLFFEKNGFSLLGLKPVSLHAQIRYLGILWTIKISISNQNEYNINLRLNKSCTAYTAYKRKELALK